MKALQDNDPSWPSLMLKVWFLLPHFFFLMQLRLYLFYGTMNVVFLSASSYVRR